MNRRSRLQRLERVLSPSFLDRYWLGRVRAFRRAADFLAWLARSDSAVPRQAFLRQSTGALIGCTDNAERLRTLRDILANWQFFVEFNRYAAEACDDCARSLRTWVERFRANLKRSASETSSGPKLPLAEVLFSSRKTDLSERFSSPPGHPVSRGGTRTTAPPPKQGWSRLPSIAWARDLTLVNVKVGELKRLVSYCEGHHFGGRQLLLPEVAAALERLEGSSEAAVALLNRAVARGMLPHSCHVVRPQDAERQTRLLLDQVDQIWARTDRVTTLALGPDERRKKWYESS
jgi:hypothetical protein